MDAKPEDKRGSKRKNVFLSARCRKTSWLVDHVELADVSEGGCSIVGSGEDLRVGQDVKIRFAEFKGVPGTVRWIRDKIAGIEFDNPLEPELIEHLGKDYTITTSDVIDIRKYIDRT